MKIAFTPISLALGLAAGLVGQKIFEKLWGLVDDEEAPSPEHRRFSGAGASSPGQVPVALE